MDESDREPAEFEALVRRFDHAVLVSIARDQSLHARPMQIAARDGARLTFYTDKASEKTAELVRRAGVAVVMQDSGACLTVSGRVSILTDPRRIRQLWQPSWALWFPAGPDDPDLILLEVEPERAEYWDRTGLRRLEFLWQAGKALAHGRKLDDENLSGHRRLRFDSSKEPPP